MSEGPGPPVERRQLGRLRLSVLAAAGGLAGIGLFGFVVGMFMLRRHTLHAFLGAWSYCVGVAIGALLLLSIIHAMNAEWPVLVRRLFEAIVAVLPLLMGLFLIVALDLGVLYPWVSPDQIQDERVRELAHRKYPYLNVGFYLARAGFYFLLWVGLAEAMRFYSIWQDRHRSFRARHRNRVLAAAALPLVMVTASFAAIDWLMSLSASWYSSMFGLYFIVSGGVGAIAWVIVLARAAERAGRLPGLTVSHWYALGRLLFASVVFWSYLTYFQLFLIWIANVPDETIWFVVRFHGGWGVYAFIVILLGNSLVPFAFLLPYAAKRSPPYLVGAALWVLSFQYLNFYWMVAPAYSVGFHYSWLDLFLLFFVGGSTVAFGMIRQAGHAAYPRSDPRLDKAREYHSR